MPSGSCVEGDARLLAATHTLRVYSASPRPPAIQVIQQSSWLQNSKRRPQYQSTPSRNLHSTLSPTPQFTVSPAVSMAADDSTTYIGITEFGRLQVMRAIG